MDPVRGDLGIEQGPSPQQTRNVHCLTHSIPPPPQEPLRQHRVAGADGGRDPRPGLTEVQWGRGRGGQPDPPPYTVSPPPAYGNAQHLKGELKILDAGCGIGGSARFSPPLPQLCRGADSFLHRFNEPQSTITTLPGARAIHVD